MRNGSFLGSLFTAFRQCLSGRDEPDVEVAPLVNVDGTPMLNEAVDVIGKQYGDDGVAFSSETSLWDVGTHGIDW